MWSVQYALGYLLNFYTIVYEILCYNPLDIKKKKGEVCLLSIPISLSRVRNQVPDVECCPWSWNPITGSLEYPKFQANRHKILIKCDRRFSLKSSKLGAGKMIRWLRAFTSLSEDLSLMPSTHVRGLLTSCNSSSRWSDDSRLCRHCCHGHKLTRAHTYTNNSEVKGKMFQISLINNNI